MNIMKSNIQTKFIAGALLGTVLVAPGVAQAQNSVTTATGGRLAVVDIKDATLKDALDLVFDSAGIKSRSIDASASQIFVPDVVRSNIAWDDLVRSLCLTYDYKFSRNRDGLYVVEPRTPVGLFNPDGSSSFPGQGGIPGPGGFSAPGGFPGQGGFPGRGVTAAPANPFGFGGAPQGNTRSFGNRQMVPDVQTRANSQTTPGVRGRTGGRNTTGRATEEPLKYTIVPVKHVYSGGIASLFANSSTITTDVFVTPGVVNGSGGGNGGGGGGFGGGSGSSFGGGGGGFGGGGFGGGGGIGGGGGFGGGGIGGGGGGFGGGGFGGGGF